MISPNIVIPFDGLNADIPSGFERDTRFEGKFPKGASSGLATTGGGATHTHTAAHVHQISTHLHSSTTSTRLNGLTYEMGGSGNRTSQEHTHNGTWSSQTMGTENCQSTSASLTATANLPPYYDVIFIKSLGYNMIPTNGMIFRTTARDGMNYHTDSENKFLRGADTDDDAGATGGATSHNHTQSHTHTANNHTHTNVKSLTSDNNSEDGASSPALSPSHNHDLSINAGAQNLNSNTTNSSTATGIEPLHTTILHYKANKSTLPVKGEIALTTETETPVGWLECNGENDTPDLVDYYIKNTNTYGNTAGANTHTHTLSHSHTGSGTHTHTYNNPTGSNGTSGGRNGSGNNGVTAHIHNITSVSSETANYETTNPTSSSENNEPPFIKVKFIEFQFSVGGGALFALA